MAQAGRDASHEKRLHAVYPRRAQNSATKTNIFSSLASCLVCFRRNVFAASCESLERTTHSPSVAIWTGNKISHVPAFQAFFEACQAVKNIAQKHRRRAERSLLTRRNSSFSQSANRTLSVQLERHETTNQVFNITGKVV